MQADIHEAKTQLSKLIEKAMSGEEVIIAKAGKPMVRLTKVSRREKGRSSAPWRASGLNWIRIGGNR